MDRLKTGSRMPRAPSISPASRWRSKGATGSNRLRPLGHAGLAVEGCQARGWRVEGPLPADTLFYRAARGDFDLVVAMYHDQGHGPVKVMGIEAGVNITVGLPVVRTSVDHGTAFDIAGTGKADERSLLEALRQAIVLAPAPQFAA